MFQENEGHSYIKKFPIGFMEILQEPLWWLGGPDPPDQLRPWVQPRGTAEEDG